jgi:uncharacterized protein YyaL (SSP411 family)
MSHSQAGLFTLDRYSGSNGTADTRLGTGKDGGMANRLAEESSPYLLQHKDNPVDWHPWGSEAFALARKRDVPVLLSVGYAACHWCHVMEHESFEDPTTARLMNDNFVSIKVDREERPDVDSVYMDAVQAMTGQGGWPMTVFLTHDGTPFFGGTYYPPEDRHGMPGFAKVLGAIVETWQQRREDVESQGKRLVEHIGVTASLEPSGDEVTDEILDEALRGASASFDPINGGFGGAPKFPQPMNVDFLLRMARRGDKRALEMAKTTLERLAAGGMFDQLAGGFARYSVDAAWTVPHFEKMLYDNAQLLRTYARAFLLTRETRFAEVAEATAKWMLSEMRDDAGGFWSSLDADSEGEEGKFYVFTLEEVRSATGDDADSAIEYFGFSEVGNFEGRNIPVLARPDQTGSPPIERARRELLEARGRRVRPGADTKVLSSWNALAASALAETGAGLDHPEWVEAARQAMDFVFETLVIDGRLHRSYRRTERGEPVVRALGVAEDYALSLEACLALLEATGERRWLDRARWVADETIRLFSDEEAGGFFSTGTDADELVVRPKDLFDNAIPSANSILALELQRLALITGKREYEDRGLGAIKLLRNAAARTPLGFGHLLGGADFLTGDPREVVVAGPGARSLASAVQREYLPNKVLLVAERPSDEDAAKLPLLEGRTHHDTATAYVCRRGVCELPVTDSKGLLDQLQG